MPPSRTKLSVHTGQYAEDVMDDGATWSLQHNGCFCPDTLLPAELFLGDRFADAAFAWTPFCSSRLPVVPKGRCRLDRRRLTTCHELSSSFVCDSDSC